MDKKVLKAATTNLRKELRTHGGKKLLPEEAEKPAPVEKPAAAEKPAAEVEVDEEDVKAKKKAGY